MTRTRSCNNPPPQRNGEKCPGEDTETSFDCESPCPGKSLCYVYNVITQILRQNFFFLKSSIGLFTEKKNSLKN